MRIKAAFKILLTLLIVGVHTCCYAVSCNCDDWMEKGGYCVDYIKTKIPTFKIPYKDEMPGLKNTSVCNVTEGDVAIFTVRNYWHVAYVEKVHRDQHGEATAIDVSEMNFGGDLSFAEFKNKWKSKSWTEWNRALCCGITDNYDEISVRKNIDLDTVKQIWSPDDVVSEGVGAQRIKIILGKIREVISRFTEFTEENL